MSSDHTVDADDDELDRIRRLAVRADADRRAGDNDHTRDADASTLDQIRELAEHAAPGPTVNADAAVTPSSTNRVVGGRPLPQRSISDLDVVEPPPAPRSAEPTRFAAWQPPERSMRPERVRPTEPDHARPWRWASIGLGVTLIAVVALWLFAGRSGTSNDTDTTTVPGLTTPVGVAVTSDAGARGSGG